MQFQNIVKGNVASAIATAILCKAGYGIKRFGIEEQFREASQLTYKEYEALELPDNVKSMPDFLVSDLETSFSRLLEVKFCRGAGLSSRNYLAQNTEKQRKFWPETHILLLVGASPVANHNHTLDDFVRVIPPKEAGRITEKRSSEDFWKSLDTMQQAFPRLSDHLNSLADIVVPLLMQLNKLEEGINFDMQSTKMSPVRETTSRRPSYPLTGTEP